MAKVFLSKHDPFVINILDEHECEGMFGPEYIDMYGLDFSEETLAKYKKIAEEFWEMQDDLHKIYKTTGRH